MSNEFILAQQQFGGGAFLFLVLGTVASLGLALAIGVFAPRGLGSTDRIAADERPGTLALIFLAGLVTWIFTPAFYIAYQRDPAATQEVIALSSREQVIISAVGALAALAVLIIGNQLFRPGGLRRLGWGWQKLGIAVPQGLLGIVIVLPLLTWVSIFTTIMWKLVNLQHPEKHELLQVLDKTPDRGLAVLLVVTAVVIAPVYEELLFRGHLQTLLRHFFRNTWVAILLSSAAFAVVHPWWTQPPIFFLAVCLGYSYERTGNLWVPVIIHSLFNTTSVILSSYYS